MTKAKLKNLIIKTLKSNSLPFVSNNMVVTLFKDFDGFDGFLNQHNFRCGIDIERRGFTITSK